MAAQHEAHVVLRGALRPQVGIADLRVVEVVERRHAEALLDIGPQGEPLAPAQGIDVGKEGGRQPRDVLRLCLVAPVVVNPRAHDRPLNFHVAVVDGRSGREHVGPAGGESKAIGVGAEMIPAQVVAHRGAPSGQQLHDVRRREVIFLLLVAVVDGQPCGVAVHVVRVIIGILHEPLRAEALADRLLHMSLYEGVQVLLSLAALPDVVDDGAGNAARRIVDVALQLPGTLRQQSVEVGLQSLGVDVTVLADGRCVPGRRAVKVLATITKMILAAGRHPFAVDAQAEVRTEALFIERRDAQQVAGTVLQLGFQVLVLAHLEARRAGADVDRRGRSEVAGGLEDSTFLSVVERHLLDVVERELPQVDLSVLRIAQHDAVVADGQVVGAHGAHVDRLDAAHAAVVLQLDAREIAQGVGYGLRRQPFELLAVQLLRGDDLAERELRGDDDLTDVLHAVHAARQPVLCRHFHGQHARQYQ